MTRPVIIVRELGESWFESSPPTAPVAHMLPDAAGGNLFRRRSHASFDQALGFAVGLALRMGWSVLDATGRISAADLSELLEATRAGRE